VKSQGQCSSCVAFTTAAIIETCFKKITGEFVDLSKQQLIDCAYGDEYRARGCVSAVTYSYLKWIQDHPTIGLLTEDEYPYLEDKPNLSCPTNLTASYTKARVSQYTYIRESNEDILKEAVYKHGAAISALLWTEALEDYTDGIFTSCEPGQGCQLKLEKSPKNSRF
jgi:hypothetical protein